MNINIKTTNITMTQAIADYTNKRLAKIDKLLYSDPAAQCDVELAKTTSHHNKGDIFKAEIHIVGANKNIYATVEREDLYASIDSVRDDVLRELKSGKEKSISFIRRGGARIKSMVKGLWNRS
ncbi:MAG: ribosome-associated translation inhibitor RaiA [Patescibacteria group bacterium]|nr:ribosome-associated translation inhibitor RaiA [Patescibacteria group bacterium]